MQKHVSFKLAVVCIPLCSGIFYTGSLESQETVARVTAEVDWDGAQRALQDFRESNTSLFDAVRSSASDGVFEAELPVLLLPAEATRSSGGFANQGAAYAAFYRLPGADLAVLGSKSIIDMSENGAEAAEATAFSVFEDGADFTTQKFGVVYVLRLTCNEPEVDERCRSPDFLQDLADNLVVVWAGEE